ncbi:hypothetical protein ABW19_dt0209272 [Dactylella cylindrospora]|nr:hypothetical protein ABW19_dt0209272 [Dactylella cylindrospora]
MGKKRFYAIVKGRTTGVFEQPWEDVRKFVDGYPGAVYKAFNTRGEATTWLVGTHRDLALGTSDASSKRSRVPPGDSTGRASSTDAPRPTKHPRQGNEAAPNSAVIEISSSPPSSSSSFVTCNDEPLKPPKPAAHAAKPVPQPSNVDDNSIYPVLPGFKSARKLAKDKEETTSRYFPKQHKDDPGNRFKVNAPTEKSNAYDRNDRVYSSFENAEMDTAAESSDDSLFNERPTQAPNPAFIVPPIEKPTIPLTPDQDKILQAVLKGENVFFTGPAGSGKSL